MTDTIRRLSQQLAVDQRLSLQDAETLVAEASRNGIVSAQEKAALRRVLVDYAQAIDPAERANIERLLDPRLPVSSGEQPVSFPTTQGQRPVFLSPTGVFTANADGTLPAGDIELGDALFRAAEAAANAREPSFSSVPEGLQLKAFDQLKQVLARAPVDGPASGLTGEQALQLRSSAGTVLLDLLNGAKTDGLRAQALETYEKLVRAETNPRLRENLIFHLSNAPAAQAGAAKEVSDALVKELAPMTPPYEAWFANGERTVNLTWTVGQGEFWKGFTGTLKSKGFRPVGPENQFGETIYEATYEKPGVGPTTFRMKVKEGGGDILRPMGDPEADIVGYDGHANWGRAMSNSLKIAPEAIDGGKDKLLFYNLCVGKTVYDRVREQYENAQVVTTFASSYFYTDGAGKMTTGEGVNALMALLDGIAARQDWPQLHQRMNDAASIKWDRTWDNYMTPTSVLTRERVLDRDNDGQADYLDKHYNYSTFKVPEDTRRELEPVRQERHASILDGTKLLVTASVVNTLSEYSGVLDDYNPDSKVLSGGWFEPELGDDTIVRFEELVGADGKKNVVMQVSARYAHMTEEALRAVAVYEFSHWLQNSGRMALTSAEGKLAGALAFSQSLSVDEGGREEEIWAAFLKRMNLPAELTLSTVREGLAAHSGHAKAGDKRSVLKLSELLGPAVVAELERPEVGRPVAIR